MMGETLEICNSFKETELGPLPVEWEVKTIGDLVDEGALLLQNGFPCGNHNLEGRGVPHLRPFNVNDEGSISLDTIKYVETDRDLERYLLADGDILFNNTNSEALVGKTAYWDRPGKYAISNHMTIIRVLDDSEIDAFYLSRYLHKRWYDGLYRSICRRHVNQASVSLARLRGVLIPLPPLPEQRRIAHVLRTIQRAIEATDQVIAAARELKRSLMHHLFTYGPVPVEATGRSPLRDTDIGPVPEHWEVVRLGEVAHKPQYGYTASASEHLIGPKFLRITDIQDDKVCWSSVPFCSIGENSLAKYKLEPGDLLFARIGATTGKTYLVRECPFAVFASYLIRVRAKTERVLPEYLYYFTQTDSYWRQINAAKGGRLKKGINTPVLKSLSLPFPPLSEQREIARILQAVDRKIEAEERRRVALQAMFKTMLHLLMMGEVRV